MLEALAFTLRILRTERMLDSSATMPSRAMGMISLCFKLIFFMINRTPSALDTGQGAVMPVTMISSCSCKLFPEGFPSRISWVKAETGSQ